MQAVKRIFCFGVVALGLALAAWEAGAATVAVTVDGVTYILTSTPLSYTGDAALLEKQPWWGNEPLAFAISGELKYQLGDFHGGPGTTPGIPSALLAYGVEEGSVSITYWDGSDENCPIGCPGVDETYNYVTAVPQSSSIPTLSEWGLVLLAALMGVIGILATRKLLRRA